MPSKVELTGGAFQDAEGNVLANGYLHFLLSVDGSVSGVGNICSGIEIVIQLDSNGNAVAGQFIWGNDNILPSNSFYKVTGFTSTGQPAWGPNNQTVQGSGTFDLGSWIPNTVYSWTPQIQIAPPQYTVANLPSGIEGRIAYATNGLKVGESTGFGTGVPVYFSNGEWRVYSTDAQVQS